MHTTLFRLSIAPNETCKFAPNAWKTVLDLRLLGIDFNTELASLAQGREELPSRLGCPKVTFPVRTSACFSMGLRLLIGRLSLLIRMAQQNALLIPTTSLFMSAAFLLSPYGH